MFRLASTATAAAVAVLLGAGCGFEPVHQKDALPPSSAELLTATQAPAPFAVAPAPLAVTPSSTRTEFPATFLAVRDGTRLAVVDTATGEDQRVPFDLGLPAPKPGQASPRISGLALSPDGTTAFFSVFSGEGPGVLYRVAVDGGQAEQIGSGRRPELSPDGRRLAYITEQTRTDRRVEYTLVVNDLVTGTERRLEMEPEVQGHEPRPSTLAWAPDSRHLVAEVTFGDWTPPLRMFDVDAATNQGNGRVLGDGPDGGEYWLTGVRATDGSVGVLVALQPPGSDDSQGPRFPRAFAVLDQTTGAERDRIDLPFAAADGTYDTSGRHQLFVADDGSVHRSHGDGFTRIPGAGANLVAW